MTYENRQKRINKKQRKCDLDRDVLREYVDAGSFPEFVLNCQARLDYTVRPFLNRYWWYYVMVDFGKGKVISLGTLAWIVFGVAMLSAGVFIGSCARFLVCAGMVCMTVFPMVFGIWLDSVYCDFEWRIKRFKDGAVD